MRLSEFILTNTERILADFEAFARSLAPDDSMDIVALRDHAREMLTVIAHDLDTPQTSREGSAKAKGRSDSDESTPDTPAQEHGSGRAISGFSVAQMVSEYRAMRASVIRLWTEACGELKSTDMDDVIRFSEAIDQALAESTARFTDDLDETRDRFLGILGHDLRSPLGAIITSGKFMLEELALPPTARTLTEGIVSSSTRMNHMVDDLLDFTRTRLGVSMPIARTTVDLAEVVEEAVEELLASRPDVILSLDTHGDLAGEWDRARLSQVLSNLLTNAVAHGSADTPISVTVRGDADGVVLFVHNHGPHIPTGQLPHLFDPLSTPVTPARDSNHLGLGLYITQQIVTGHDGTIEVESTAAQGTTFTVRLPRQG